MKFLPLYEFWSKHKIAKFLFMLAILPIVFSIAVIKGGKKELCADNFIFYVEVMCGKE